MKNARARAKAWLMDSGSILVPAIGCLVVLTMITWVVGL